MAYYSNSDLLTRIQSKADASGNITRQALREIKDGHLVNPSHSAILQRLLSIDGLGKQLFNVKSDFKALTVKQRTVAETWAIIDNKSILIDYKQGVGIHRKDLLLIANDIKTPVDMVSKLRAVMNDGTQDYYTKTDFQKVFNLKK